MEKLVPTALQKGDTTVECRNALQVREFILLFYGASWDTKSQLLAEKISSLLLHYNKNEGIDGAKPRFEAIYCSNDNSEQD